MSMLGNISCDAHRSVTAATIDEVVQFMQCQYHQLGSGDFRLDKGSAFVGFCCLRCASDDSSLLCLPTPSWMLLVCLKSRTGTWTLEFLDQCMQDCCGLMFSDPKSPAGVQHGVQRAREGVHCGL